MPPIVNIADAVVRIKVDSGALTASIRRIQSQTSGIGRSFGRAFNPVRGLIGQVRAGLSGLGTSLFQTSLALTAIGAAGTLAFKSIVSTFAEFEQAATNAAAVSGLLGNAFRKGRKEIAATAVELGTRTVFTAREAATAMADLARKGFDPVTLSVKELQPLLDLAAATQSTLQLTTETVTSSLNVFALTFKDSADVADVFTKTVSSTAATMGFLQIAMSFVGPVAKAAGVDFKEVSATLGFLADRGIRASTAGTALRKTMASLLNPSRQAKVVLDELKLTERDLDLETNGLIGVMENLRKAGINTSQIFKIFGLRAAPAVAAMVGIRQSAKSSVGELKKLDKALNKAGGTARKVAELQLDTLQGRFTILKSNIEATAIALGEALAPALGDFAEFLTDIVKSIRSWIQANRELIGDTFRVMLDKLKEIITSISDWVKANGGIVGTIAKVGTKIVAFSVVVGPAALAVSGLVSGLASFIGVLTTLSATALFKSLVQAVFGFGQAIVLAVSFLGSAGSVFKNFFPIVRNLFALAFSPLLKVIGLIVGIGGAFLGMFTSLGGILAGGAIVSSAILLVDAFGGLEGIWDKLRNAGRFIIDMFKKIPNVFQFVIDKFNEFTVGFTGAGEGFEASDVIGQFGLLTTTGFKLGQVWEFLKKAWLSFTEGFKFGPDAITDPDLVSSAWVKAGQTLRKVWDTVKNAFTAFVDFLTGPWKETALTAFKTVGVFLREGLTQWKIWIAGAWVGIKAAFTAGIDNVKKLITKFKDFVIKVLGGPDSPVVKAMASMSKKIVDIWGKISDFIGKAVDKIIEKVREIPEAIGSAFTSFSDFVGGGLFAAAEIADVSGLAKGGRVSSSGFAVVGEQGPELVRLPGGSRVFSNQESAAMSGGGVTININGLTVRDESDIRKLGDEIDRVLSFKQRADRRRSGL